MNWRQQSVAMLAAQPTEWLRLAEVFATVEPAIPAHLAMRCGLRTGHNDDIGLNTARWRLFLHHIKPLVERSTDNGALTYRTLRTDLVRLRPDEKPCATCGKPRYLAAWPDHGMPRHYNCLNCQNPKPVVVEEPAPQPAPLPKPRLVIVPPPPPRQRDIKLFDDLASLSSLEEIWDEFAWMTSEFNTADALEFKKNRRLRWTLHRALNAGVVTEYQKMSQSFTDEMHAIRFPSRALMNAVVYSRSTDWLREKTGALTKVEREQWANIVREAYCYGAITVISITIAGELMKLKRELEPLVAKLKPPPQRSRAPPKLRWRTALKNIARWRLH